MTENEALLSLAFFIFGLNMGVCIWMWVTGKCQARTLSREVEQLWKARAALTEQEGEG